MTDHVRKVTKLKFVSIVNVDCLIFCPSLVCLFVYLSLFFFLVWFVFFSLVCLGFVYACVFDRFVCLCCFVFLLLLIQMISTHIYMYQLCLASQLSCLQNNVGHCTTFSDLDLGWGSQCRAKQHLSATIIFLHTFQLIRMKFHVVLNKSG